MCSGEEKPSCSNCDRQGEPCDYSIRLNWGGRTKREPSKSGSGTSSTGSGSPYTSTFSFEEYPSPLYPSTPETSVLPNTANRHARSLSRASPPRSRPSALVSEVVRLNQPGPSQFNSQNGPSQQGRYNQSMNGLPIPASFHQYQFQTQFEFPSSAGSAFESFSYNDVGLTSANAEVPLSPPSMPPPRGSADIMYKRHTSSQSADSPATTLSDAYSPNAGPPTPYNPFSAMPLTPSSSIGSEDPTIPSSANQQSSAYPPPDLRRLSVQSLINNTQDNSLQEYNPRGESRRRYPVQDSVSTTYGYDMGLPDFDTPRNKDHSAIAIFSPPIGTLELNDDFPFIEPEPHSRDMAFGKGGYYAKPVQIRVPKSLEPLPQLLMENKMNLLYFHHFINHTARILVPHDCEKNPFRQILPESKYEPDYFNCTLTDLNSGCA